MRNDWGFFQGSEPKMSDVDSYYTRENHRAMFGEEFDGTDYDLDCLRRAAREEIARRASRE